MLASLVNNKSDKEPFCWLLLFSINPSAQKGECEARIQTVVRNAVLYHYRLLTDTQLIPSWPGESCLAVR
ncbi:hypothetical protein BDV23DRAFT_146510 [Aspergillus alliaceus]|uniref:Uncharacterized protein n=1 Tax=Petromyces alliaceus TaxID=209559 RepID=A0A5N6FVN0_PETAA|nr:uncharacterized protein BDW43DRAFT_279039 [Aspergillus alliaceus]KAB8232613.1 hypothetical protein BDW43DRAFT_279039 [Aspergillus alliaceus]KAE8394867.1 hypothetical protein BDV23DRAFT_146510 [Aspergillus alliaceus]